MRYLPLNQNDRAQMLSVIGVDSIDDLFTDVPKSARLEGLVDLPKHQSEQSVETFFQRLSNKSTPAGGSPDSAVGISNGLYALSAGNQPRHIAGAL